MTDNINWEARRQEARQWAQAALAQWRAVRIERYRATAVRFAEHKYRIALELDPLFCPNCGRIADRIFDVEDADASTGYRATETVCARCVRN